MAQLNIGRGSALPDLYGMAQLNIGRGSALPDL